MKRALRMEELEERIAPTVIVNGNSLFFTDANGDQIHILYDGPDGSQVEVLDTLAGDIGNGDDIGFITFTGATLESELVITTDGDDIVIDGQIEAPGDQDVGLINIGMGEYGEDAGEAVLGTAFTIDVGGRLGTVAINGDFDCDTMDHFILAGDDIGMIAIAGDLHLNSGTAEAGFAAGPGGETGDISFISVGGDVHIGTGGIITGGSYLVGGGVATIHDDAGTGDSGTITLRLSGAAPAARYLAIPVAGGGSVLSFVRVTSSNTQLSITATGTGGDVTEVEFLADAAGVTVSGAADTDVFGVSVEGSIGSIVNRTVGGDIAYVDVMLGGDLGLLQTGRMGNLGAVFTGAQNAMPVFWYGRYLDAGGSIVDGTIGKIQVGAINSTAVEAGAFGAINVKPGQIMNSQIITPGDIASINAGGLLYSDIMAEGSIGKVAVGSGGMSRTAIYGLGGISSVAVKGVIAEAIISAQDTDGGDNQIGAGIGSVTADAIIETEINALGDIGNVKVKGAVWNTNVKTRFWDVPSSTYKGGSVVNFSAGGMYGSEIDSLGDVTSVRVGKGGMLYESAVVSYGDLGTLMVQGDVDYSQIYAYGTLNALKVLGAFSCDSELDAGAANTMSIRGAVFDSVIDVTTHAGRVTLGGLYGGSTGVDIGSAGSVTITGGVCGTGETILYIGSYDSVMVKGDVNYADFELEDGERVTFTGEVYDVEMSARDLASLSARNLVDFDLQVDDDLGSMKVAGSFIGSNLTVYGEAGPISISGDVLGGDIELSGPTAAGLSVRGDVANTGIQVGENGGNATDTDAVTIRGSVMDTGFNLYGPLDRFSVGGSMIYTNVEAYDAIGQIKIGKSALESDIDGRSTVGSVSVGGHFYYGDIDADGGLGNVTIKGNLMGTDIMAENYDVDGDPIAADIANITAAKIYDTDIVATGNIGMITAKTLIADTHIRTVAYDNWGGGPPVGGGSIAGVKAAGLIGTLVKSWGDIGRITLGSYGVNSGSNIYILDTDADFHGLTTSGLIAGEIYVAGDLTGSILSGGADALLHGGDYHFMDANGSFTGGRLFIDGTVQPGVTVS